MKAIEFVKEENYLICGRHGTSEVKPGSVLERCFACHNKIVVFPDSQRLLQERADLELKLVCGNCWTAAPDQRRIRPLPDNAMGSHIREYLRNHR